MVTTAHSIAIISSRAGKATISFDFSFAFVCAWTWLVRGEGRDCGSGGFRLGSRTAHGLAIDGDDFARRLVRAATQSTKQRWNASASSVAKISPSVSAAVSIGKGRRATTSDSSPTARCLRSCRTGKRAQAAKKQHLVKGIDDLPRLSRIRQSAEITKKRRPCSAIRPNSANRHTVHRRPPRKWVGFQRIQQFSALSPTR